MVPLALVLAACLAAALERIPRLRFASLSFFRPLFATDVLYLLTGWIALGALGTAAVLGSSAWLGALGVPRLAALELPLWASIPIALVAIDLGNYSAHWLLHRFDPLWELHKIHHSSRRLDWLATFRSHLLEQALRRAVAPLGLILLGVPVPAVAFAVVSFNAWAIFNHSNLAPDLAFLEPLFITPRLHRLHHEPSTSHQNLGTVFSVWDRLRGKLVVAELPPETLFGVPGEADAYPQGFGRQLVEPLRHPARPVGNPRRGAAQS
jgi:sterol desaturase/sphingolipid hydroxylase (fatty acid hydroxylase superfamily)